MEYPIIIVGGNLVGLWLVEQLSRQGLSVLGLERKRELAPDMPELTTERIHSVAALETLSLGTALEWKRIETPAVERSKGQWLSDDKAASDPLSRHGFFVPAKGWESLSRLAIEQSGSRYETRKEVVRIDPEARVLFCQDGTERAFSKLYWCAGLAALKRVLGRPLPFEWDDQAMEGALLVRFVHRDALPELCTLNFRFREARLRAIACTTSPSADTGETFAATTSVLIRLEADVLDDKEETAKCLRAFKRELSKELPELQGKIEGEQIVYLSRLHPVSPSPVKSLEIAEGVRYCGAEIALESTKSHHGLELSLHNTGLLPVGLPEPIAQEIIDAPQRSGEAPQF